MKIQILCFAALLSWGVRGKAQTSQDCPNCDLRGRNFSGQDLTNVNFSYARLDNANFSNCVLNGAMFDNANLQGANFSKAQLNPTPKGPANFSVANCSHAVFSGASLHGAVFTYANTNGTVFNNADMTDARLGLKLVVTDSVPAIAPSFDGAIVPCSFRRFAICADLSKAKFPACQPPTPSKKVACNIYVSTTGTDDDNCGTVDHPCLTVGKSVDRAPDNGVIGFAVGEYNFQAETEVQKNLAFVGGLDDQNQWEATEYQSLLCSGYLGIPVLSIFGNIKVRLSNFILNGDEPTSWFGSYILWVFDNASLSLSQVNCNAGGGGSGRVGFPGIALGPNYSAGCGQGGKASSDTSGHFDTYKWVRGPNGGSGTCWEGMDDCAYSGKGGEGGGASIGIDVYNGRLEVDNTVKIIGAHGGDGGNGGEAAKAAGGGAGGNGSPSYCVVLAGNAVIVGTPVYYAGSGGDGGNGGTSPDFNAAHGCNGHAGEHGIPSHTAVEVFRH